MKQRWLTRVLLVLLVLVPILWVWPQRGMTASFYASPHFFDYLVARQLLPVDPSVQP